MALALARARAVGAATLLAGVLLGVTAAAAPLYLDAAAGDAITAAVRGAALGERPALTVSTALRGFRANPGWVQAADEALVAEIAAVPALEAPTLTVLGEQVTVAGAGGRELAVTVLGRTGAGSHLHTVTGSPQARGIWLAERHADELGVTAGDRISIVSGPRPLRLRVAGVHRDLLEGSLPDYWRPVASTIRPQRPPLADPGTRLRQRPLLVTEPDQALAVVRSTQGEAVVRWESMLATEVLSPAEAASLRAGIGRLEARAVDRDHALGASMGRMGPPPFVGSPVPGALDRALAATALATTPMRTLQLATVAMSLAVVVAGALFLARREHVEVRREVVLGVPDATVALRLVAPTVPVLVLGVAGGWALAAATAPGGESAVSPAALLDSAVHSGLAALCAVAAAVGACVVHVRRLQRPGSAGAVTTALGASWDVAALALAGAAAYQLWLRGSALVVDGAERLQVDLLVVAFPLLAVSGLAGMAARLLRRVLPWMRGRGGRLPVAAFLAYRRLARPGGSAVLLLTVAITAMGLSSYSSAVATSARAAELDKARTRLGSDVVVTLPPGVEPPVVEGGTVVGRATGRFVHRPEQVDLVAVDDETFAGAVSWHPEFADVDLDDLLARLAQPAGAGAVPALAVGAAAGEDVARFAWRGVDVPIAPVAAARDLPGRQGAAPTILVARRTLEQAVAERHPDHRRNLVDDQLWFAGPVGALGAALPPGGLEGLDVTSAAADVREPQVLALAWTLDYLRLAGALAVLLALTAAVGHAAAGQQQRAVTAAIGSRLGLSSTVQTRAVGLELVAVLSVAALLGWLAGAGAAGVVVPLLDPLPDLAPRPRLRLLVALPFLLLALAVVTATAGAAVARLVRPDAASELRTAG